MTAEEIQRLTEEALAATPGKAASVRLVLRRGDTRWVILVSEGGEELALHVDDGPAITADDVREQLVSQARILF